MAMAFESSHSFAGHALPTPSDTPFESPTFGASQRASHYGNSSSPPPFISEESPYLPRLRADREGTKAEKRSSLDPRRFTLDLDNSLVQQIHALQLQLESKTTAINGLEESLHQSKIEASQLSEENRLHQLKTRQSQKQWRDFETEMIGAMENMVKDRDNAVEEKSNLVKRADEYKKRLRSQEEEADRARSIREKEEEAWSNEKRQLELRLHKSEAQLENMLAGIAAVQSSDFVLNGNDHMEEGDREKSGGRPESAASYSHNRADSRTSVRSSGEYSDYRDPYRRAPSSLSALHEMTESMTSSLSLAEELDGEETEQEEDDPIRNILPMSPTALPEESEMRHRYSDPKTRRMMELRSEHEELPVTKGATGRTTNGEALDYLHASRIFNATYTNSATQCTPPSSPTLAPQSSPSTESQKSEQTEPSPNTTNHRRKRVSIPSLFMGQSSKAKVDPAKSTVKTTSVSTACQTDEWEPSTAVDPALRSPSVPMADVGIQTLIGPAAAMTESVRVDKCDAASQTLEQSSAAGSLLAHAPSMTDADTQTSEERIVAAAGASTRLVPDTSLDVPLIAIHPPASRPPSSHTSVVLPPRTKNAACQAVVDNPRQSRSISVQTDPLRFSKPLARMPPRAASSQTVTQLSRIGERQRRTTASQPPDIQRRHMRSPPPIRNDDPPPASPPISSIKDVYPGSNDDGPLDGKSKFGPRRPIRSNSIFAGFSDENEDIGGIAADDFTDDEFANAPPIRKTLSKVKNSWKLVPQAQGFASTRDDATSNAEAIASASVGQIEQPTKTTSKTFNVRGSDQATAGASTERSAAERPEKMVASNYAPMISRQRSPSAPNVSDQVIIPPAPPIPVPTRSSSRKLPISKSDGAGSPTPYSTSFFTSRRAAHQGRQIPKRKAVRKTQSAAAVTLPEPPAIPAAPVPTATSSNPPSTPRSLSTRNQFSIPFPTESEERRLQAEVSRPVSTNGSALIETQNQQTSVVDAIAQTMVGEWMWKYVRKRTSFGISENPQAEFESGKSGDSGGARHKRWVWLAPYERAVIWSGKQPTSGPALLGKGGRKLAIQSVLDVKDDRPLPKGAAHEAVFDRSILILTPERALKFTATSKERHYIWLTALSFLSASTQGMAGLDERTPSPEQQQQKYPRPPSQEPVVGLRRGPIRDSIRISKSKSRPSMGAHSFSSPPTDLSFTHVPTMSFEGVGRPSEEAAEPPQVPRIAAHARKRSSTGPRAIPLSALQNYPNRPLGVASSMDLTASTIRERYEKNRPWSPNGSGHATAQTTMTQRTTESNVIPNDYFDAVGTVRMEAFVDNKEIRREEMKRDKEARSQKAKQSRKKGMAYSGVGGSSAGRDPGWGRSEDPFRGF